MTLDERIKSFRRVFPRPTEWDSAWKIVVKLVHDLLDNREVILAELVNAEARVGVLTVACEAAVILTEDLATEIEELKAELDLRREA